MRCVSRLGQNSARRCRAGPCLARDGRTMGEPCCRSQAIHQGRNPAWRGKEEPLELPFGNEARRRRGHASDLTRGTDDQEIFGARDPDKTDAPFFLRYPCRDGSVATRPSAAPRMNTIRLWRPLALWIVASGTRRCAASVRNRSRVAMCSAKAANEGNKAHPATALASSAGLSLGVCARLVSSRWATSASTPGVLWRARERSSAYILQIRSHAALDPFSQLVGGFGQAHPGWTLCQTMWPSRLPT